MKKITFFQILLLSSLTLSYAQILGDIILSKETSDNNFCDIIQIQNENSLFVLCEAPPKVIKTDLSGNEIWSKQYSQSINDRGYAFASINDSGYVIAGGLSISSDIRDIWIIRCNSGGDTIWTRRFNNLSYTGLTALRQIKIDNQGNYVTCGYIQVGSNEYNMLLIKISPQGDLIFFKNYGGSGWEEGTDLQVTPDNGYIISGYTKSFGGVTRAAYIVRTDTNGDTLWTRTYTFSNENWFRAIDILPDGNFICGGWTGANVTSSDIWMVKIKSNGDTLWTKKLTSSANWRQVNRLISLPSGKIGITGYSMSSIYSCKTDSVGNMLYFMSYSNGTGLNISQSPDGNFYIVGQKQFLIGGNAWLLKVYSGEPSLPVELISFTASLNGNEVMLNWSTASEINNRGFEIERTPLIPPFIKGGTKEGWRSIGFVDGNGTTTEKKNYSFIDTKVESGKYLYRLKQIDFDGSFEYSNEIEIDINHPTEFALYQNYPNPFNSSTKISWQSSVGSWQTVKVFDVLGNEIATLMDEYKSEGSYELEFDGINLSSGIYFYKLNSGGMVKTKKMILLK